MGPTEGAAVGLLVGRFIYHRWIHDWVFPPKYERVWEEIKYPRADEGTMVPLFYGKCRIRQPVLAWIGEVSTEAGSIGNGSPNSQFIYRASLFFVLGIPFSGDQSNTVHGLWEGEHKFTWVDFDPAMDGNGGGLPIVAELDDYGDRGYRGASAEWLNGNSTMDFDASWAASRMIAGGIAADEIPGYRGYVSVFLFNSIGGWYFGNSPSVPAYSFEVSSYQTSHAQLGTYARVGSDSNPINVIYDLLIGEMSKLGYDSSYIDISSFQAAQYTLHTETHGYSRVIDNKQSAEQHIMEILRQIDAVLYEDPDTSLIGIKLIRNDYDPLTIPHITQENCVAIQNFAASGWEDIPNKVKIIFTNREDEYRDGTGNAHNIANVDHQAGETREISISMPGVCVQELADNIAGREIEARSRPMMKMRAIVDRSKIRIKKGDAVKVTWTNPNIAGLVFRVADVDRGTLTEGQIALDLIQDYYYVWRNQSPKLGTGGKLDTPPITTSGG